MTTTEYNQSVELFSDKVFRFILKNVRDKELANDIVQESYLRLWEQVEHVDLQKAKSWLFSTSYRHMIDLLRRDKRKGDMNEANKLSNAYNNQYNGIDEVLNYALNRLPNIQKSVVMLRDYEGYSYDEIAEITKLTSSQVKVYIFRARKALKDYLVSVESVL